jgi:ferredoxin
MTSQGTAPESDACPPAFLEPERLDDLIHALRRRGYRTMGPTRRDGAIVYDELESIGDLPVGWTDEQAPGRYRLRKRDDQALFAYASAAQSWKQFLHPPTLRLWRARRTEGGVELVAESEPPPRYAFLGVRACDLEAIRRLDQVMMDGPYVDHAYRAFRREAFIVAVNCCSPAGTCFCVSMRTGPGVTGRADLVLTEVADAGRHFLTVVAGTLQGQEVLDELGPRAATEEERRLADAGVEAASRRMGRSLAVDGLREALAQNPEHPRWDQVSKRCLTCGSCTLSCPTCFCSTVEDVTALRGDVTERRRLWDTCFSLEFSYLHGGSVRMSPRSRYRQWLTHKLSTWHDQFGVAGCVGCGRCITWCPVGIDITEEASVIRQAVPLPGSTGPMTE